MKAASAFRGILVDAGNTSIRLAVWQDGDRFRPVTGTGDGPVPAGAAPLRRLGALPTPAAGCDEELAAVVATALAGGPDLPLVVCSVVPHVTAFLRRRWPATVVIDYRLIRDFGLDVDDPAAVGADRLCNVAAAVASGLQSALVVDAGTATTFDLLLDGAFVGGLIAPGMALAAACLGRQGAQLAEVPFVPCPLVPGRDTRAALQAGCFHAGLGGAQSVISQLCQAYGPVEVIVTGGLGHLLMAPDRLHDPDWTLRGAAVLGGLVA